MNLRATVSLLLLSPLNNEVSSATTQKSREQFPRRRRMLWRWSYLESLMPIPRPTYAASPIPEARKW